MVLWDSDNKKHTAKVVGRLGDPEYQCVFKVRLDPRDEEKTDEDLQKGYVVIKRCRGCESYLTEFINKLPSDFLVRAQGVLTSSFLSKSEESWLVFPFFELGDLGQYMLDNFSRSFISEHTCYEMSQQLLKGLADLHKGGVLHRDIKTGNVFVTKQDDHIRLLIGDFGGAKNQLNGVQDDRHGGTYDFLPSGFSPIKGHQFTAHHDLYGLAMIMLYLYTGFPVFNSDTPIPYRMTKALMEENATYKTVFDTIETEVGKYNVSFKEDKKFLFRKPPSGVQDILFDMLSMKKEFTASDFLRRLRESSADNI